MSHINHTLKFMALLLVAVLVIGAYRWTGFEDPLSDQDQDGMGIMLQPPAIFKSALAQETEEFDFTFILDEAGVTAYTKINGTVEFINLESRFKTIRQQTDQFISGIVIAPGYEKLTELDESGEVQVFLHEDGWIIAYLSRWQPASALFDWVNYDEKRLSSSTLIENVVRMLAADIGVADFNIVYYDFRYPKATNLLLAAERIDFEHPWDFFEINVPRGLTVYENSWSFGRFSHSNRISSCSFNDEQLGALNPAGSKWGLVNGELSKSQLPQDTLNKLVVIIDQWGAYADTRSYCGIAVVYQEAIQ